MTVHLYLFLAHLAHFPLAIDFLLIIISQNKLKGKLVLLLKLYRRSFCLLTVHFYPDWVFAQ